MDDRAFGGIVPMALSMSSKALSGSGTPLGAGDGNRFDQRGPHHGREVRVVAKRPERAPRERSHPAEHRQPDELRPDVHHDVVAQRAARTPRGGTPRGAVEQRRSCAVERAEDEAAHGGMANHARFGDDGGDVCRAAGHVRRPTARVSTSTLSTPF